MTGCDRCGSLDESKLYVTIGGRGYCARCWHECGCPFPRNVPSAIELDQARVRNEQAMLRRGGTDRHLVRAGLS